LTTFAQSDTCYTKDENRLIAEKLIDGANCKEEVVELQTLVDLLKAENKGLMQSNSLLVLSNDEKQLAIDKGIKKVKRRDRVIFGLVFFSIVQHVVR
jgi:hypothetical protein